MRANIILAHNYEGSITRIAWMYAKMLAARGWTVTVSYPYLTDQFDYQWWLCPSQQRLRLLARLAAKGALAIATGRVSRSRWVGETVFGMTEHVSTCPYLLVPTDTTLPDADFILCLQPQLLPWLLRMSKEKGEIIDSIHTSDYEKDDSLKTWFDHVFQRICRQASVKRFAVSRYAREFFEGKGIRVDEVVHNGIDTDEFALTPFEAKKSGILMFSDPRVAKGYPFGIQVLGRLKAKYPTLRTASVGNIAGLDTRVFDEVHGFVKGDQIASIYQRYRYFLFPSLYEGFPGPPLEAMSTGAIAILAKVSGIEEYALDGVNSMTFTPGNLDEAVAAADRVLLDDCLGRRLATAGRSVAEEFSWDRSVNTLIGLMTR